MKRFTFLAVLMLATISVPSVAEFNVAEAVGPPATFAPLADTDALAGYGIGSSFQAVGLVGAAGTERAVISLDYSVVTAVGLVSPIYARIEPRHIAAEVGGWPS